MPNSDSNLPDKNSGQDKSKGISGLRNQLSNASHTVPTTPGAGASGDKDLLSIQRSNKINKIRSLGKIDVRSPIINRSLTTPNLDNQGHPINNEEASLYTSRTNHTMASKLISIVPDAFYSMRNYYDDFTTIDWAKAFMETNKFQYELHHKGWFVDKDNDDEGRSVKKIPFYYRAYLNLGRWILIILTAFAFSLIAYSIDKLEIVLVGFKHGYCSTNWLASQVSCCVDDSEDTINSVNKSPVVFMNVFKTGYVVDTNSKYTINEGGCSNWVTWDSVFSYHPLHLKVRFDFIIYVILTILLAFLACILTLSTKISGQYPASKTKACQLKKDGDSFNNNEFDLNDSSPDEEDDEVYDDDFDDEERDSSDEDLHDQIVVNSRVMYTAAGSGVPEVKTILSGFVIRRFLGSYTLVVKTIALVFAIASGMALGKEGPYVHLAAAVGNVLTRLFPYVSQNDLIRKQVLSAAALSGVALAFGSPLGGVLFILEEINHSLPSYQLFQIFVCAIVSTLFLKFLNPYGSGNTVLFELDYSSDWSPIELVFFIIIGIAGGIFGACFVKFIGWWPKVFRKSRMIKNHPIFEVILIALLTGIVTFWNPYTKQASSELVLDLATPCSGNELDRSLCPNDLESYANELITLAIAFVIKVILTFVTFGLKLPIGIYVPSMVIGALFGRLFAMTIQFINIKYDLNVAEDQIDSLGSIVKNVCLDNSNSGCIDLGIYAMISAGAFMAGVTRMNITLVTILFELTSSYTYVLPISISIAVANWMGNLIESNSLYEALLILNDYPFMSPETEPIDPFKASGDIISDEDKFQTSSDSNSRQKNVPTSPQGNTESPSMHVQMSQISQPSPFINRNSTFLQTRTNTVESLSDHNKNDRLYIDITQSPYVPSSTLKDKLILLGDKSLLDGCIPLVRDKVCVGLLFFPELEFCIDRIDQFCISYEITEDVYCKLFNEDSYLSGNTNIDQLRNPVKYNLDITKNIVNTDYREVDYFNYGSVDDNETRQLLFSLQNELLELADMTHYIDYSPIFLNHSSELSLSHLIFDKIGNRVIVLIKDGKYFGVLHKKTLIDYLRRQED